MSNKYKKEQLNYNDALIILKILRIICMICIAIFVSICMTFIMKKALINYELSYLRIVILNIVLVLTIILGIVKLNVARNNVKLQVSNYRRDWENLLPPALAEVLIDRDIDMREMVMATILQLVLKKNIEIIDNEKIVLLHKDNVEEYEKNLIDLIFCKSDIITFYDVNTLFNEDIAFCTKKISNIKVEILKKLKSHAVFNKRATNIDATIRAIVYIILGHLPLIVILNYNVIYSLLKTIWIWIFMYFTYITFVYTHAKKIINKQCSFLEDRVMDESKNEYKPSNTKEMIFYILLNNKMLVFNALVLIYLYFFDRISAIIYLAILVLGVFIIKSKYKVILSKKGQREKTKLMEFKKYIKDYSLMDKRDMESIILWDEYLAYAVAFGIPTKITSKVYEEWYHFNLIIKFFN